MVLGRISEVFAGALDRLSAAPRSSGGLPPQPGGGSNAHDFYYVSSGRKTNMRLSSSLQDFSSYSRADPEAQHGDKVDGKNPSLSTRENVSSFSKDKGLLVGTPCLRRRWVRAVMIFLCVLLFAFLVYTVSMYIYTYWAQGASKYYVVLDCGSTGTRVFVYQASVNYKKDNSLPIVMKSLTEGRSGKARGRAYDRIETEPGIDKLVHNITGLKAVTKPLIRWAKKQIPKSAHKSTSLFLYATAGVRRLPVKDSKWLLDNAWAIFNKSPFSCRREWVKIIDGTEEAYYGWTALNYGTGVLGALPKKPTFGALDLGGSSLQVTFENGERMHNETNLNFRIGAVNHHLSAYSLAGYGLNDAFGKSVAHLLKTLPNISKSDLVNGNLEIKHPCMHSGFKQQYVCPNCASIVQEIGASVVGGGGKSGVPINLIGASSWSECTALAKAAVNYSEWSNLSSGIDCDLQPCALPESYPHPYGQFYAVSGFFVVYRFFNLTADAALDDVLEKGREFCNKTWEMANSSVPPQPFIEQYCFRASYVVSLLREGLHITDSQVVVGSGSITWTLGVALLEAGKSLSTTIKLRSYDILPMKANPIIIIAIVLVTFVLLLCVLSHYCNCLVRYFRRSYLPIFRNNSASTASVLSIPSPFSFQRWSPINMGDGRVKTPLSPTVARPPQRPFSLGHGLGGSSTQLMESSLYSSSSSVLHSYSSDSLGQMQLDSSTMGSFWSPHRNQRLQSRRSQSREDLNMSMPETHLVKL